MDFDPPTHESYWFLCFSRWHIFCEISLYQPNPTISLNSPVIATNWDGEEPTMLLELEVPAVGEFVGWVPESDDVPGVRGLEDWVVPAVTFALRAFDKKHLHATSTRKSYRKVDNAMNCMRKIVQVY